MKDDQEFNIWFVKEMEKYPCLYNHHDPNYNIRSKQDEAWQAVADSASSPVGECKERWKNLRASFTRHLKHRILEMKNGNKGKKPYYLAGHMNFLLPFTRARSFPEDNLKYYCDIIKMHDNPDNVVYLDSEEDTNYSEDLKHNAEVDMLNEENDYPINDHHLILNENENENDAPMEVSRNHRIYDMLQNLQNSSNTNTTNEDVDDIKFHKESFKLKRIAENEHDQSPDTKRQRNIENDADLNFLKSLLPDIKTMTGSQKRKFKINVLKLIDETLEPSGPSTSQSGAGDIQS
ncbi:uncharacterized protein LOC135831636 [Planococcus citri]|uniref:uncharacterized protein LOC135831636 n=1 Tax=Planococcus citri TaxID=170843 RepID=UPI0031F8EFDA